MDKNDVRASVPIYTPAQVGQIVGMPPSTVYSWTKATNTRRALVHHQPPDTRGWPSIPLLGLAEASVIRALRDGGMRMPQVAAAIAHVREREGEYALGSPRLVHDGAMMFLASDDGVSALIGGQVVLPGLLDQWLQPFRLAPDGFVEAYLPPYLPGVEADPRFSSGRLRFTRTGVPLFAVAGLLEVGDDVQDVAREFDLTVDEVELVREHLPRLARAA